MKYSEKAKQGIRPFQYDKNSRSFNEGAWRHWSPSDQSFLRDQLRRPDFIS